MTPATAPSLVERLRKVAEFIDGLVRLEQPAFDQPPEPTSKEDYDLSCAVGELNDIAAALTAVPAPEGPTECEDAMGQAYQVIGAIIAHFDLPDDPELIRALDYFAANKFDPKFLPWAPQGATIFRP